jgi:hypothetical protein
MALLSLTACGNTGYNPGLGAWGGGGPWVDVMHIIWKLKKMRLNTVICGVRDFSEKSMIDLSILLWHPKRKKTYSPPIASYRSS